MSIVNSNLEKIIKYLKNRLYEMMREFVTAYTYTLGESECQF